MTIAKMQALPNDRLTRAIQLQRIREERTLRQDIMFLVEH